MLKPTAETRRRFYVALVLFPSYKSKQYRIIQADTWNWFSRYFNNSCKLQYIESILKDQRGILNSNENHKSDKMTWLLLLKIAKYDCFCVHHPIITLIFESYNLLDINFKAYLCTDSGALTSRFVTSFFQWNAMEQMEMALQIFLVSRSKRTIVAFVHWAGLGAGRGRTAESCGKQTNKLMDSIVIVQRLFSRFEAANSQRKSINVKLPIPYRTKIWHLNVVNKRCLFVFS